VSPILVRPFREQVDHDRVIRQLQAKFRRKYAVAANVGSLQENTIRILGQHVTPDLVLTTASGARRLQVVVEVETSESTNDLEAMAQWVRFAKARAAFHLYVPAGMADVAKRICQAKQINVSEIWTYFFVGDVLRFTMFYRSPSAQRSVLARKSESGPKVKKKVSKKKQAKKKVVKKKVSKKKVVKKKVSKKKVVKKKTARNKVVKKKVSKKKQTKKKVVKKKAAKKKATSRTNVKRKTGRKKRN